MFEFQGECLDDLLMERNSVSIEQPRKNLVDRERRDVRDDGHVYKLDDGPLPAVGLAPHNGQGGRALHGKCKEHQQRHSPRGSQLSP